MDDEISMPKDEEIYDLAKTRAQHSVVTYLMGRIFLKYYQDFQDVNSFDDINMIERLWLLTSLYHDIVYTLKFIKRSDFNFEKEFKKDYLLAGDNQLHENNDKVLAYTYDEIKNYSEYRRITNADQKDIVERIDHGILGGCLAFRKVMRAYRSTNIKPLNENIEDNQIFCMTIAQHNIFKSYNKERDKEYLQYNLCKLVSNSNFRINKQVPLLLLLSRVDTIECVKKFAKEEVAEHPMQVMTVLKKIKITCDKYCLYVDYTHCQQRCLIIHLLIQLC